MARVASLALLGAGASALTGAENHWAVIVAGSNSYSNYRHQADACHAYQIMKAKGVPEDQIILMAYDDIANNSRNPFPGKIYNKPDPNGPGVDVYAGCNIDYKGSDVTPQNFMNVLTGTAKGKKLGSTSADNVFVFFSDHGAPGLIAFPSSQVLHKNELQSTFQTMSDKKMFKKLVFYLEACESGSMFQDMSIPNVYALSASNPTESSWGSYCGSEAQVNGVNVGSCLGDLFSVNWMEDSDAQDTTQETLTKQFQTVKTLTDRSEVMQWGDVTFTEDKVSEYIGGYDPATVKMSRHPAATGAVSARQIDLERLYFLYSSASSSEERLAAGKELQAELATQMAVDTVYTRFLELVYPDDAAKQESARTQKVAANLMDCELATHEAFTVHGAEQFDANSGFALQFHQIVVNVCADVAGSNIDLPAAAKAACQTTLV